MNFFFFAQQFVAIFVILAIFVFSTSESAVMSRNRRAIEDYYSNSQVVHNVVNDRVFGGSTSLGWAQVPHVYSPMFSPVFGR